MMLTILLGAEGCAEIKQSGWDWVREATAGEVDALRDKHGLTPTRWTEAISDAIGRPYFPVTLLDGAPAGLVAKISKFVRVRYLSDHM